MRRAHKVDANQAAIFAVWRRMGCLVVDLSGVGDGCPDALVAGGPVGEPVMVEIKSRRGKLGAAQTAFATRWPGRWAVIRSVDEAIAIAKRGGPR